MRASFVFLSGVMACVAAHTSSMTCSPALLVSRGPNVSRVLVGYGDGVTGSDNGPGNELTNEPQAGLVGVSSPVPQDKATSYAEENAGEDSVTAGVPNQEEAEEVVLVSKTALGNGWMVEPVKIKKKQYNEIQKFLEKTEELYNQQKKDKPEIKLSGRLDGQKLPGNSMELFQYIRALRSDIATAVAPVWDQVRDNKGRGELQAVLNQIEFSACVVAYNGGNCEQIENYNPFRMFWTSKDIARKLISREGGSGGSMSDPICVSTCVYLLALSEYLRGITDEEKYNIVYRPSIHWLKENKQEKRPENAVAWALQRAISDSKTQKLVIKYNPRP